MHIDLIIVLAVGLLLFGFVSKRIERTILTAPMLFLGFGLLVSPQVLDLVHLEPRHPAVHLLAELTLILVLFADAARIDLGVLRKGFYLPARLLLIGMPLTIVLGTAAAMALLPQLGLWEAALLAAMLAPTDAALGQIVVTNRMAPPSIRQALNVESGINDGVALPAVLILAALADRSAGDQTMGQWSGFVAGQLLLGPAVGAAVGYLGGRLVVFGTRIGWMSHDYQEIAGLMLPLLAFAAAEAVGGNGFIAAFCAGLTLGNTARSICECFYEFVEAQAQLFKFATFLLFGALLFFPAIRHANAASVVYAVLSLTVIRMIPVALGLIGLKIHGATRWFLGWFGPRGLASILFGLIILERHQIAAREEIFCIVSIAVLMSVVAHGATAYPGVLWYGRAMQALDESELENSPLEEKPVRISHEEYKAMQG